jgi:hypothetical protein
MGVDYSSTDAAFGFQPYGQMLRAQLYAVATAPTINVAVNDIVVHGSTMVSTPVGYLPIIEDGSVPDGDPQILGSVIACFDENMKHLQYIAATRTGNSTIAGYVMVADHPDQLFLVQEDGDGNAIDLTEAGMNCDLIAATLCAPDTNTGLSTMELDSTSAANTEALQFRLLWPHQDDTPATDTQANARWVVRANEHFYSATQAGLA